ncbi:unnamed protein product [Vitrella brassicaformis CCMP3155]|uniref:SAM domain-containing protein n=3 Tax=Vitrella brassicaformis TaxID=1169539 RepID=A0A0G4EVF2_VITBC|nr:unnamed protein product [Vitrella brassicaformis CCMP3155]|eukprot:CEM02050.1 unnamed protein product [Vitrella brassicaformis CCMP3155]
MGSLARSACSALAKDDRGMRHWCAEDLAAWLNDLHLPSGYADRIRAAGLDGQTLVTMDREALANILGITHEEHLTVIREHIRRFLRNERTNSPRPAVLTPRQQTGGSRALKAVPSLKFDRLHNHLTSHHHPGPPPFVPSIALPAPLHKTRRSSSAGPKLLRDAAAAHSQLTSANASVEGSSFACPDSPRINRRVSRTGVGVGVGGHGHGHMSVSLPVTAGGFPPYGQHSLMVTPTTARLSRLVSMQNDAASEFGLPKTSDSLRGSFATSRGRLDPPVHPLVPTPGPATYARPGKRPWDYKPQTVFIPYEKRNTMAFFLEEIDPSGGPGVGKYEGRSSISSKTKSVVGGAMPKSGRYRKKDPVTREYSPGPQQYRPTWSGLSTFR